MLHAAQAALISDDLLWLLGSIASNAFAQVR